MLEIHEILGREVDEIDDVRRKFELLYTEDYFNPKNGDWISDDYFRIIDLSTKPGVLDDSEMGKLNRSIDRLNGKIPHLYKRLGNSSLLGAYNRVAEQVNFINASTEDRKSVVAMQPIPADPQLTS